MRPKFPSATRRPHPATPADTATDKPTDKPADKPADTSADTVRDSLPVYCIRARQTMPTRALRSNSTVCKESIVSEQAYEERQNQDMMHSLITRIWLEEDGWRGYLINVDTGKRHYVRSTAEVMSHYLHWLQTLGVQPTVRERLMQWLSRL